MFKIVILSAVLALAAAKPSNFALAPSVYSAVVGQHDTITSQSSSVVHPTPVFRTIATPVIEHHGFEYGVPAVKSGLIAESSTPFIANYAHEALPYAAYTPYSYSYGFPKYATYPGRFLPTYPTYY